MMSCFIESEEVEAFVQPGIDTITIPSLPQILASECGNVELDSGDHMRVSVLSRMMIVEVCQFESSTVDFEQDASFGACKFLPKRANYCAGDPE